MQDMSYVFTFPKVTGQLWKYRVWQALYYLTGLGCVAVFSVWIGNPADLPRGLTLEIAILIGSFWLYWWIKAIRCPRCKGSPVLYHIQHLELGDTEIAAAEECPICGFDPASPE
jgi:hypothetical protein